MSEATQFVFKFNAVVTARKSV